MDKITVLLCEDEPLVRLDERFLIEDALKDAGIPHEILEYRDGMGALDYLRQRGHAHGVMLLTDNSMVRPGQIDGIDALNGATLVRMVTAENLRADHIIVCSGGTSALFNADAGLPEIPSVLVLRKPILSDRFSALVKKIATAVADGTTGQGPSMVNSASPGLTVHPV